MLKMYVATICAAQTCTSHIFGVHSWFFWSGSIKKAKNSYPRIYKCTIDLCSRKLCLLHHCLDPSLFDGADFGTTYALLNAGIGRRCDAWTAAVFHSPI